MATTISSGRFVPSSFSFAATGEFIFGFLPHLLAA